MSSVTLYRKYRPQNFEEIINQDHIKSTVRQEILTGQLPHAFLFHGPRGIGKTTIARVMAKALNCQNRGEDSPDPCEECEACISIRDGKSLNLIEIDAASQTGVDHVRDNIIANARVAVKSSEYKIFLIDEVHMLSASSFNALLKTLEEPPARVIFILATTEIHKIPATILSRCQRFDFHPITGDILKEHLEGIIQKEGRNVDESVVKAIVKKSGGHVRDAISLLGQILSLEGDIIPEKAAFVLPVTNTEEIIRLFTSFADDDLAAALRQLQELEQKGLRPQHFCSDVLDFAHKLLLYKVGSHPDIFEGEVTSESSQQIDHIAGAFTTFQILHILDILMKRAVQLKDYDQGKLPLELAAVEIASLKEKGGASSSGSTPPSQGSPNAGGSAPSSQASAAPSSAPSAPTPSQPQQPSAPTQQAQAAPASPSPQPRVPPKQEQASSAPSAEMPADAASFQEVNKKWKDILHQLSENFHSLFIVLRTAELREADNGAPRITFGFKMHHDYTKTNLASVKQEAENVLGKQVHLEVGVDENVSQSSNDEVAEPTGEEKEELAEELNSLAEAFGGSVLD